MIFKDTKRSLHENEEKYHEIRFYSITFKLINIEIQYFVNHPSFLFKICNIKKKLHCICRFRAINAQIVSKEVAVPFFFRMTNTCFITAHCYFVLKVIVLVFQRGRISIFDEVLMENMDNIGKAQNMVTQDINLLNTLSYFLW